MTIILRQMVTVIRVVIKYLRPQSQALLKGKSYPSEVGKRKGRDESDEDLVEKENKSEKGRRHEAFFLFLRHDDIAESSIGILIGMCKSLRRGRPSQERLRVLIEM